MYSTKIPSRNDNAMGTRRYSPGIRLIDARVWLRPNRGVAQAAEGFAQRVQLADDPHDLVGQYGRLLLAVEPGQQGDDFVAEGFQVLGLLVFGQPLPPAAAG